MIVQVIAVQVQSGAEVRRRRWCRAGAEVLLR